MEQSHIIQRQVFELQVTGAKTGFEWERRATQYQEDVIAKGLDDCFDAIPMTGRQLIIEKLEIDLGSFSPESFRKEGRQRLVDLLGPHLQACFQDGIREAGNDRYRMVNTSEYVAEHINEANGNKPDAFVLDSATVSRVVFLHFLEHGRFPWWYARSEVIPAMETLFGKRWMEGLTDDDRDVLKYTLQKSERARIRVANHFNAEWIGEFLQHIDLFGNDGLRYWKSLLPILAHAPAKHVVLHQHFWVSWMEATQAAKQHPPVKALLDEVAGKDQILFNKLLNALQQACAEKLNDASLSKQANYLLNSLDKLKLMAKSTTDSATHGPITRYESGGISDAIGGELSLTKRFEGTEEISKNSDSASAKRMDEIHNEKANALVEGMQRPDQYQTRWSQKEEVYFIQAAGLILLHPFLPELMGSTGIWTADAWSSPEAGFRGVKLLSYLSFGNIEEPEHQLLFHKLLMGMEMDVALEAVPPLTSEETTACEELLQAAVSHWKALGNVSPASLQEGYLQREGKLQRKDDGYYLQIEHKTLDVLLARLPWGYSTVKLPWMSKIIHTSWI